MTENKWKQVSERPVEDKIYLVAWLLVDGTYSPPHRACFLESEGKFVSLENYNSHPIVVDIYLEIPEPPKDES